METETEWPEELAGVDRAERARISLALHSDAGPGFALGIRADAHGILPPDRGDARGRAHVDVRQISGPRIHG